MPDVVRHFHDLAADPDCPRRLDALLDLRFITSMPTLDKLQAVGAEIQRVRSVVEFDACAIVAETDEWFATAKVFEVVAARQFQRTGVFRRVAAAEEWLAAERRARKSS